MSSFFRTQKSLIIVFRMGQSRDTNVELSQLIKIPESSETIPESARHLIRGLDEMKVAGMHIFLSERRTRS